MAFNIKPEIVVKDGFLFNTKEVVYTSDGLSIKIPEFSKSDGVTLNGFTKIFFSTKEFLLGAEAAMIHDFMCRNKGKYDRKLSSKFLRDIWVASGLNPIKGFFVYIFTDLYQFIRYGKEWKS